MAARIIEEIIIAATYISITLLLIPIIQERNASLAGKVSFSGRKHPQAKHRPDFPGRHSIEYELL